MKKHFLAFIIAFITVLSLINIVLANDQVSDETFKGFDEFVEEVMADWKVPGLSLAVIKDGKVIYEKGYGFRDIENKLDVTPETIFPIASTTKAFTGMAAGMLVDEGKLDLDKPIINYMPCIKFKDSYTTYHITATDLLNHTSGIPGYDAVWYKSEFTTDEVFNKVKYLENSCDLHQKFQYNNIIYSVSGYLIKDITGKTWAEYVKEKITMPLGMDNTSFTTEDMLKSENYSMPYVIKNNKVEKVPFLNVSTIAPAGGMNSTVLDLSKWVQFHLNLGKVGNKQLVSLGALKQIYTPKALMQAPTSHAEFSQDMYAYGWVMRTYRGHLFLQHCGGIDGYMSHVSFMPKDQIGVVLLMSTDSETVNIIPYNIYDRLLGLEQIPWNDRNKQEQAQTKEAIKKAKETTKDPRQTDTKPTHPLKDYAGTYTNELFGDMEVKLEGKELKGLFRDEFAMRHYHYDVFEGYDPDDPEEPNCKVTFLMDANGDISSLSMPLVPELKDEIIFIKAKEK